MEAKKTNGGELMKAEPSGVLARLEVQEEILSELKREKNKSRDYFQVMQIFDGDVGDQKILDSLGQVAEKAEKEEGIDPELELGGLINRCHTLAFAVGYIYGQEFKIRDKAVLPLVEELRQRLIDEGVLSFTSNGR